MEIWSGGAFQKIKNGKTNQLRYPPPRFPLLSLSAFSFHHHQLVIDIVIRVLHIERDTRVNESEVVIGYNCLLKSI